MRAVRGIQIALDRDDKKIIEKMGAVAAFKGYRGYPATVCASINEEIVHGIPGDRKLVSGDILSIDVGLIYDGFVGDMACTVPVGPIDDEKQKLLEVTEQSLEKAIEKARPENRLSDISHAVESWTEKHGFSVVRDFVGHGRGR